MCNLYSMTRNREAILRLFRVSHNRAAAYETRDAIFPGYQAPVARKAADGERELVVLNWGFVLLQKDKAPKRVTNIRDDKAQTKFWRTSFEQRRCLAPASSYCEPKGEKPATWHWFSINGDDARAVFAFPGVWTRYKGPLKKNGETLEQEVFAFMTTEPNELTASINHERMPVLLPIPPTSRRGSPVLRLRCSTSRAAMPLTRCGWCSPGPNAKTCWRRESLPRESLPC
jgi:putative SOS response-associated peptidase YedK